MVEQPPPARARPGRAAAADPARAGGVVGAGSCRGGPCRRPRDPAVLGAVCPWVVLAWVAVGVVLLATACSSDDGSGPAGEPAPAAAGAPSVPAVPAAGEPGTGTVVIGGTARAFEVTGCALEPDPAEPEAARALLAVTGAGTTGRGEPFTIELQRFATTLGDATTYTDTITYEDPARILQAQRIEVGGQVTDLRDPSASSALLRPRSDGISGAGLAGAPGDDADDEGVVGLALDATCP